MMVAIAIMFCVSLSLLLTTNAASRNAHMLEANDYQLDHPFLLPRKLLINKKVEGYEVRNMASPSEQKKVVSEFVTYKNLASYSRMKSGKTRREEVEVMVHAAAAKGTRQEWIEGSDPIHEFFTMDYAHVKRRRPIHNKSYPKTVTNSP